VLALCVNHLRRMAQGGSGEQHRGCRERLPRAFGGFPSMWGGWDAACSRIEGTASAGGMNFFRS